MAAGPPDGVRFDGYARKRLNEAVFAEDAEPRLKSYFAGDYDDPWQKRYTGRWFERLGGGGDRPEVAHRITGDDIVAVSMLGIREFKAHVAANLLDGPLAERMTALLEDIPTCRTPEGFLETAPASVISPASAAWQAWVTLTRKNPEHRVGNVTAHKLLARKRPALLPVYDNVVFCWLGRPGWFWESIRRELSPELRGKMRVPDLVTELKALRAAAVPPGISLIRVLDVLLWTKHQKQHRLKPCPDRRREGRRRNFDEGELA